MHRTHIALVGVLSLAALITGGHSARPDVSRMSKLPHTTVWAWERREDLRTIAAHDEAVAYLDQSITIEDKVTSVPRRQPLLVPETVPLMAVVRIEAPIQSARLDLVSAADIAQMVANSATRRGVRALQVDFDAARSQRDFYTELLGELRKRVPGEMPLSITALASWCGNDDWIAALPVDEAVPMYFRMGRDGGRRSEPGWRYPLHEPLCKGSAGVSMDEPWPEIARGTRLYVFHPKGWNEVALENLRNAVQR